MANNVSVQLNGRLQGKPLLHWWKEGEARATKVRAKVIDEIGINRQFVKNLVCSAIDEIKNAKPTKMSNYMLEKATGINRTNIGNTLAGKTENPEARTLISLIAALDVTLRGSVMTWKTTVRWVAGAVVALIVVIVVGGFVAVGTYVHYSQEEHIKEIRKDKADTDNRLKEEAAERKKIGDDVAGMKKTSETDERKILDDNKQKEVIANYPPSLDTDGAVPENSVTPQSVQKMPTVDELVQIMIERKVFITNADLASTPFPKFNSETHKKYLF